MFGSNYPVDSLCASYDDIVYTIIECMDKFSNGDVEKIFFKNAIKYYNPI